MSVQSIMANPKRPKKFADRPTFDLGTPQRRTKGDEMRLEDADAKDFSAKRLRVLNVSPMDKARARGEISERQWHAGLKFQSLWQRGHVNPLMAINLNPRIQGGKPQDTDETIRAQREFRDLCKDIGDEATSVLIHVVVSELAASVWADQRNLIPNQGLGELREALNAVAHAMKVT